MHGSHKKAANLKQLNQELRDREEAYRRQFYDNFSVMLLIDPTDGRIMDANDAAVRFYGYTRDHLLSMAIAEINVLPANEVKNAIDSLAQKYGRHFEFKHRLADGTLADVEVSSSKIIIGGRTVLHSIIHDITDRKQAEEALLASNEKFSKTFDSAPMLVSLTDLADGKIIEVNDQYCEVLGYTRGELIGNTTLSLGIITPEDRKKLIEVIKLGAGTPKKIELKIRAKTSQTTPILFSGNVIEVGERKILISMLLDITELKQAEAEKIKLHTQLQQAQKMKSLGTLVAGVAHNINNVLAVALGTASLREDVVTEPADREAYKSIGKVCRHGREVVKSLVHFAQPTLVTQAPFEMNSLIQEVCALLESITKNQVQIVQSLIEEPLWINGNAGDVNHILVNLGINSLDAMPDRGNLTFRTVIRKGNWVEVSIEDNGIGMTSEVLAHALEPFFTTKDESTGAGLGLSMTYGVVKAHCGTIDITSQPGQGTTVKLRFPRIPAPVRVETVKVPALPLRLRKVLLVDDEEDVRFLMGRMLKKASIGVVETAASGEEALEKLLPGVLPDVLILDQNMPGMTGVQLMAKVRDRYPDMPILFSSGQPDIESWEILKQPRVAVISKPFTVDEIQAKLAQFSTNQI